MTEHETAVRQRDHEYLLEAQERHSRFEAWFSIQEPCSIRERELLRDAFKCGWRACVSWQEKRTAEGSALPLDERLDPPEQDQD
jgi:hypothetical protein